MTNEETGAGATQRYLQQLRYELRYARKGDREDYLAQIGEHLQESQDVHDSPSTETLAGLKSRIGSPRELAKEFYAAEKTRLTSAQRGRLWIRRWWISLLLGVVVVASVSVIRWAATYQPLSLQLAGSYQDSVVALSGKAPLKLSEGTSQPVTWRLTVGHYRMSILFAATNTNELGVSISPPPYVSGIPNPATWRLQSIRSLKETPFHSASVSGHWYREVVFSTTYTCVPWPNGNPNATSHETTYITQLPVTMSFMVFQHVVELPVQPFYLEFVGDCFKEVTPPTSGAS